MDLEKHNRKPLRWVIDASKDARCDVIILTVLQSVVSVSMVVFALVMRRAIDAAVTGSRDDFILNAFILGGIILGQLTLRYFIRRTDEAVRADTENALKERAYCAILGRSYEALSAFHTGELQNRMTNDTVVVTDGIASIFPDTVALLVKLIGAAVVLFYLDHWFALVFLLGGVFLIFVTYLFRRVMKQMHKRVQEADGSVRSFLQETVGNLLVIRSYGGENKAEGMAVDRMRCHKEERLHRSSLSAVCNLGFGAVMQGGYLFGLVWCGLGILNGSISYGTLAAVLQLVGQIQSPVASITGYLPKYYAMLASAERLMELEELEPDAKEERMPVSRRDDAYGKLSCIVADNIGFTYPVEGAEPVLAGASVSVGKGELVAITGRSGIGKSTLLKLLLSVYKPDEGVLFLECDDGYRLPASPVTRPMFAYVPQGNFLLSGKIWETVTFLSEGDPDRDKVKRACHIACADFVDELPQGLDTVIGEKGEGLSEGQVQRLAIARAVYFDAPVLLLDEATSALDAQTEKRLLENLRRMTDKTVLIVTHREAALSFCDRVIEIRDKVFMEAGNDK